MHQATRPIERRLNLAFLIVALLSLLAFVSSALVVQTHRHPDHRLFATPGGPAGASSDRDVVIVADDPCALCDALPAFEAYMAPTAIALPIEIAERFSPFIQTASQQRVPMSAHDWQSRAPPRSTLI